MRFGVFAAVALLLAGAAWPSLASAQEADAAPDPSFKLGEIVVTAPRQADVQISTSSVSSEAIYAFSRDSLDQAAQLIPGVTAGITANSRNERLIYVRGFDRYQVPLSIDGIRVYLPADGRLDYGRFLTPDIAKIQVAKGYASVLDGPGAMGGAVNLVTRTPTKALEVEGRATLNLDNDADYGGYTVFGLVGTKHDKWYAQASYTRNFTDHWDLSNDFAPTANEDGGARDLSRTQDWRVNAKIGFTPNETDEYALSFTRQEGSKDAPVHVSDAASTLRYWSWPWWNLQSVYFLSTTQLGALATLKTKLYYNNFDNSLDSFDTKTLTTQTKGSSFNSAYADRAYGGSAQLDLAIAPIDRLGIAFHYRNDRHREYQESFAPQHVIEPWQTDQEETYSAAIENRLKLAPTLELVTGFGYDWRQLNRAEDYANGALLFYPLRNASAWNAQGQLLWTPDADTSAHVSVSSRARFPTIFERFSTRFGGAVSNPDLDAERATHYEIGGSRDFGPFHAEGAAWYARVSDAIIAFPFIYVTCTTAARPVCTNNAVSQSRNVGSGDYYGAELALSAKLASKLSVGGNYSWIHRTLNDPSNAAFHLTSVPTHKAFLYADWSPVTALHILPNLDVASDRWVVNTAGTRYYRMGSYALVNLRMDYEVRPGVAIGVGGRNLFDDNYSTADGYPEAGRSLFASLRVRY
ncbi:TonB-dependent receptor [soil metagenome]